MIKIRRGFGFAIVKASHEEITALLALNEMELDAGDKVVKVEQGAKLIVLPPFHHVHRNPIRKPIIAYIERREITENERIQLRHIEDKERADADAGKAGL